MRHDDYAEMFKIAKMADEHRTLLRHLEQDKNLFGLKARDHLFQSHGGQAKMLTDLISPTRGDALRCGITSQLDSHRELFGMGRQSAAMKASLGIESDHRNRISQVMEDYKRPDAVEQARQKILGLTGDVHKTFAAGSRIGLMYEGESQRALRMLKEATSFPKTSVMASLGSLVSATTVSALESLRHDLFKRHRATDHASLAGLTTKMYESSFAYNRFATRTLAQIGADRNESRSLALTSSLLLANEQAIRTASVVTSLVDRTRESDSEPDSSAAPPMMNLYRVQQDELLDLDEDLLFGIGEMPEGAQYETLVPLAQPATLFEQARRCFELIAMCNETSQTCNGVEIFKPTPAFQLSFANLLCTVACTRPTLTNVVQNLYIVLYEAAGKDKLRYIEGKFVTSEECEVVWCVKHLRNKWLSHDADHGKEGDIKRDRRKLVEALESLGVERMPVNKNDYINIHGSLLDKVEQFLTLLLQRIAAPSTIE